MESAEETVRIMSCTLDDLPALKHLKERVEVIAYEQGRLSAEKAFLNGTDPMEERKKGLYLSYFIAVVHAEKLISDELYEYWNSRDNGWLLGYKDFRVEEWLRGWCHWMDHERLNQAEGSTDFA